MMKNITEKKAKKRTKKKKRLVHRSMRITMFDILFYYIA